MAYITDHGSMTDLDLGRELNLFHGHCTSFCWTLFLVKPFSNMRKATEILANHDLDVQFELSYDGGFDRDLNLVKELDDGRYICRNKNVDCNGNPSDGICGQAGHPRNKSLHIGHVGGSNSVVKWPTLRLSGMPECSSKYTLTATLTTIDLGCPLSACDGQVNRSPLTRGLCLYRNTAVWVGISSRAFRKEGCCYVQTVDNQGGSFAPGPVMLSGSPF
ncbi:MAG: hypothetical protein J3Q66DRAFT_365601 [Benniella sp.]|nr:MAG: hypothetical protein J3Q66DRAFT_365601 [Benniella sp.]